MSASKLEHVFRLKKREKYPKSCFVLVTYYSEVLFSFRNISLYIDTAFLTIYSDFKVDPTGTAGELD